VAVRPDGATSFPALQAALSAGADGGLIFYAFDLLALNGWDLRGCTLLDRKRLLCGVSDWTGQLRYSDHHEGGAEVMHREACRLGLEGIVCKQDMPYRAGRGGAWVKVKCSGRDEFIVLGLTPPGGSRSGFGALHVGYYDLEGHLHYAGGVGSGFDEKELGTLRSRLDRMPATSPEQLLVSGDPIDRSITWVRPEIVIEVQYTDWSGSGRLRHPVYLGIREDKAARDVIQAVADPDAERTLFKPGRSSSRSIITRKGWHGAVPPLRPPHETTVIPAAKLLAAKSNIISARAPKKDTITIEGVQITHPDRQLWPGVSKKDLAEYWQAVSVVALQGIAKRPLSILRCPDGIDGKEQFFQKNGHGVFPPVIRQGSASKQPYLAIDDLEGLVAMAQMSAIELHAWGADEVAPTRPDRLVFDLDPGEGVAWSDVIKAAHETRERLMGLGLVSFCRTTGGKGLHVVAPLKPGAHWSAAKPFCRAFAEAMATEHPSRFLAHLKIADRRGRILVDWLRNGLGATAVASFSPRARPGATVATPVTWGEVTPKLDPSRFTVHSVPERLAKLKKDPWQGFDEANQYLPDQLLRRTTPVSPETSSAAPRLPRQSSIIVARPPKPRRG
jgi:bifunctional non-homologous end joining protein LigD